MTGRRLSWWPVHSGPFRFLPRQGEPLCVAELVSQTVVKALAYLPVYVAVVVTVSLLVQVFGLPFGWGE